MGKREVTSESTRPDFMETHNPRSFIRSPVGREATFSLLEFMFIRDFGLPWIDIDGFRLGGCKVRYSWESNILVERGDSSTIQDILGRSLVRSPSI